MNRDQWEEPAFGGAKMKMEALQELSSLSDTLLIPAMQAWKKEGKPVVGYFCSYVPEEILYAAGALPYRVRPVGCAATPSADGYLSHVNCSFVRSCLEYALEGRYDFLDGLVFCNSCDHVRRLYDVWRETADHPPLTYMLQVPHKSDDVAVSFYRDDIAIFQENVEKAFGTRITEEKLKNAIHVYNETRGLLKTLYELRQEQNPPITGAETLKIVLAATAAPPDQYNQLLRRLLEELKDRERIYNYRARVMIMGGLYDDPAHTQIIEDLGGLVVTDALCFGSRHFWQPVENSHDPLLGLARSYLRHPPCARMSDMMKERDDFVSEMVDKFSVDGIIYQWIRYCDLWGGELFHLREKLKESGTPLLSLEREYVLGGAGQVATRVQAFLERIGG
jgi:benzoyl-CoA reductase subunit C